jgi:nitrogen fixation protein NifT
MPRSRAGQPAGSVTGTVKRDPMKVMIRKTASGAISAYVPKKDLEETIVSMEHPGMWGGNVTLSNGWQLLLPQMDAATTLPITVEARRIGGAE